MTGKREPPFFVQSDARRLCGADGFPGLYDAGAWVYRRCANVRRGFVQGLGVSTPMTVGGIFCTCLLQYSEALASSGCHGDLQLALDVARRGGALPEGARAHGNRLALGSGVAAGS